MNTDIRVSTSFKNHRKRVRLTALLGCECAGYLINLWITAAVDRPDGTLTGWDKIDIAVAAGWDGSPEKLFEALTDKRCNFLDILEGSGEYRLHDWEEHQAWVIAAPIRSEIAKRAASARWEKRKNAAGMPGASGEQCPEHAPSNAPTPTPTPTPTPKSITARFAAFWSKYPKKKSKGDAEKAFKVIKPDPELFEKIMAGVKAGKHSREWAKQGGQFIPYPATFLRSKGWEDEFEPVSKPGLLHATTSFKKTDCKECGGEGLIYVNNVRQGRCSECENWRQFFATPEEAGPPVKKSDLPQLEVVNGKPEKQTVGQLLQSVGRSV